MSKTRCNNPPPPTELLIYRHSRARYLCMNTGKGGHFTIKLNTAESARGRHFALQAMTRKYAK